MLMPISHDPASVVGLSVWNQRASGEGSFRWAVQQRAGAVAPDRQVLFCPWRARLSANR